MRGATWSPIKRSQFFQNFNPRTPCGVRLDKIIAYYQDAIHFNPRTPCGVRHPRMVRRYHPAGISIHAPHAGCDERVHRRAGVGIKFQSTHPMRGATGRGRRIAKRWRNFNPRTPCGVRPRKGNAETESVVISIHAPHAGCDRRPSNHSPGVGIFQSTHPMRGATRPRRIASSRFLISIHAPHAGCDHAISKSKTSTH